MGIPRFSAVIGENNPKIALTALRADAKFNSEPTPIFTLNELSFQVADGTVVGDGSVTSQNALEGPLLKSLQQLSIHPIAYRGKWTLQKCD